MNFQIVNSFWSFCCFIHNLNHALCSHISLLCKTQVLYLSAYIHNLVSHCAILDGYSLKMSDTLQTRHCQGEEEGAALEGTLGVLGLDQKNTYTCVVLKTKISKIPHAVLGVHVDASQ